MAEDMLAETLRDRLPRLHAAGVDPNELHALRARIHRIEDWPAAWSDAAEAREAMGSAALAAGRRVSAGEAFQTAALYWHFAQFVWFDDPAGKLRLQHRQRAAYARAAPLLRPPAEIVEVPFEGLRLSGNLRLPRDATGLPPCVLLNPGADSTREEFHSLENVFLARGLATFSFDGPGQGPMRAESTLRPDYEAPIAAILDRLTVHGGVDPARIGIWGRSFGAYCALRGATDARIRACVAIGGFFDLGAIWDRMPKGTTDALAFGIGAADRAGGGAQARAYTLEGVLGGIGCPVLIVHSGQDNVCPVTESELMVAAIGPQAELAVFAEGNHVCDNIPWKVRPLMADWLAERLGASP
jgi:dienelactone hydrolase